MTRPALVILAAGRARRYGGPKQLAPVGVHGETIIDLIADDARAAGFGEFVLVINEETGPLIQAHVAAHWPRDLRVRFVHQGALRGTVDAVATATAVLDERTPFGVSNADDLYGRDAFAQLGTHLATSANHCLVGYRLENALLGNLPVSRGTCHVVNHHLTEIVERRQVHATLDGYVADDGLEPATLHARTVVSMNLWGFRPSVVPLLHAALAAHDFTHEAELQLSTFVGQILHHTPARVDVLETEERCIGVTHADDLAIAQRLVAAEVAAGRRPATIFLNA